MVAGGVVSLDVPGTTIMFDSASAAVDFFDRLARDGERVAVHPMVDAEDGVANGGNEIEVVSDHDDGHFMPQLHEGLDELGFDGEIDVRGGLIEEKKLGIAGKGAGDHDALALASGEIREWSVGEIRHPDFVESGTSGLATLPRKRSDDESIKSSHEDDIESGNGKLGIKTHCLRHVTHGTLGFSRALTQNLQRSLNRFDEAEDELYES